jgi:lysophospholipase L1-like esterase
MALLVVPLVVAGCGGASDTAGASTANSVAATSSAASLQAPAQAQAVGPAVAVMPLGDSITYGVDGSGNSGGYRIDLSSQLIADGLNVNFVGSQADGPSSSSDRDHEGHPGWRIDEIANQIDGWMDAYKPEIVMLMIGTNDMVQNRDVASAPNRLSHLIDQITAKAPASRVLVASLTPLRDASANALAQQFNAALPAIVQGQSKAGKNVRLVNIANSVSLAEIPDGIHPNASGYSKMAVIWHNALLPHLRTGSVALPLDVVKSFQVTTPGFTDRYIRHAGGLGYTEIVAPSSSDGLKQDATFKIVRGLADGNCYSLESKNFAGEYLRHANSRVRRDKPDGSDLFRQDATWCARPGLSGNGITLESKNYPGRYMRHYNAELWLIENGGPLPSDNPANFALDVSWNMVAPWPTSQGSGSHSVADDRDAAAMSRLLSTFDPNTEGWTKGLTLDAIINSYERTRDPQYLSVIERSFQHSRGWHTPYFDDIGWYANAWLRAYDVIGDVKYLDEAKAIFNQMTTAWDGTCGGGLWWSTDRKYKNAITSQVHAGGVLKEANCEDSACPAGDHLIFKGAFVQGPARLYNADRSNKPVCGAFLASNAESAWTKSRDGNNGLGFVWVGPVATPNNSTQASAALLIGEVALLDAGGETSTVPSRSATATGR